MLEGIPEVPTIEKAPSFDYETEINEFLGEKERELISEENIAEIKNKTEEENINTNSGKEITYNKHNRSLFVDGVETTAGEIVASRHFYTQVNLPEALDATLAGRQLREKYMTLSRRDIFIEKLNLELAKKLAEAEKHHVSKREAYLALSKKEVRTEQKGFVAEKMMIGAIEMISINRSDLGIEVRPANAFQDVEEKIDFIITTKKKRKSVGIEEVDGKVFDEKSFGIQFTINTNKGEFKKEQIQKAKDRGLDVDDLLYVEIDKQIINNALEKWEEKGKPICGPWGFLSYTTKEKAIENLFKNILTEEQIKGIIKGI